VRRVRHNKGTFETRISPPWMCVTTTKRCATRECHLGLLPKGNKGEGRERGREGGREGWRRSQASQATN